eukprot:scaffold16034_cov70-Attheya_sp.AAC.2
MQLLQYETSESEIYEEAHQEFSSRRCTQEGDKVNKFGCSQCASSYQTKQGLRKHVRKCHEANVLGKRKTLADITNVAPHPPSIGSPMPNVHDLDPDDSGYTVFQV